MDRTNHEHMCGGRPSLRGWCCCSWASGKRPAQQQSGTLTGTIVDDTGAVVPGVTAAATEKATGLVRTVVATRRGSSGWPPCPRPLTVKVELTRDSAR